MKLIKRLSPRRGGYTLVELVVTIVILAVVSIPAAVFIVQHIEAVGISRDFSMAVHLARSEMEHVKSLAYADIVSAEIPDYLGYPYDIVRSVSYVAGNDASAESLKEVRVEARGAQQSSALVIFVTYIARNIGYGV